MVSSLLVLQKQMRVAGLLSVVVQLRPQVNNLVLA